MYVISIILVVISILILLFGFTASTGAPQEAVVVALAIFFSILARMAQASGDTSKIVKELKISKNE